MNEWADVTPIRPAQGDDAHPLRTKGARNYCRHRQTMLDHEARRVECRRCGATLDPYDVLAGLAGAPERYIEARDEARRQARVAEANLADLLRQERNAKARKRKRAAPSA